MNESYASQVWSRGVDLASAAQEERVRDELPIRAIAIAVSVFDVMICWLMLFLMNNFDAKLIKRM